MDLGVFLIVIFILSEAKHLFRRERELSREDFLTGLLNSRAFAEKLTSEITRVRRYRHQITIAYIDLDNFKQVNDRYGHHAGDLLLCAVANVLRGSVREVDAVARLGETSSPSCSLKRTRRLRIWYWIKLKTRCTSS